MVALQGIAISRNRGVYPMKTPMAVALAAAFTAGMVLVPMSAEARMPPGAPGEEAFEASLDQLLEDENTQVQSEVLNDPTTADLLAEANAVSPKEVPREVVTIDKIRGVPGDEKFETELTAWLEQEIELQKYELSRDTTGVGRTR
jgi:acyl-CoA synthetase (AMP-forming)/AMP-acid ligase II